MYDNVECAVVINGQLTEWFRVEIGVRKGCLLSLILFSLFLEFVAVDPKSLRKEFKLFTKLRYAEDTTIMSTVFDKLQLSTEELHSACRKWCMKINFSKCKFVTSSEKRIVLESDVLETVEEFCFFGGIVPSTERDVSRCIVVASAAFGRLKNGIFSNRKISTRLKARLCGAPIPPTAIHSAEAWTVRSWEIMWSPYTANGNP